MLRGNDKRLTAQGNTALNALHKALRPIYREYRDKGYSIEEVHYMITFLAGILVSEEVHHIKEKSDNDL